MNEFFVNYLKVLACVLGINLTEYLWMSSNFMVKIMSCIFKYTEKLQSSKSTSSTSQNYELSISSEEDSKVNFESKLSSLTAIVLKQAIVGIRNIAEDDAVLYFKPKTTQYWNLLYRNLKKYAHINPLLHVIALVGLFIRYTIILPIRLVFFVSGFSLLILENIIVCCISDNWIHRPALYHLLTKLSCKFIIMGVGLDLKVHYPENKPTKSLAIANHTSVLDGFILNSDCYFDVLSQNLKGIIGICQNFLVKCSDHIFFERKNTEERSNVIQRIKTRANDNTKAPILIFPEGVCVNNSGVLDFKKKNFEIDCEFYPITIKYDARFSDPFWWQNAVCGVDGLTMHFLDVMTSWGLVCHVYYHKPMQHQQEETVDQFTKRVKKVIVDQGNFIDIPWTGDHRVYSIQRSLTMRRHHIAQVIINEFKNEISM